MSSFLPLRDKEYLSSHGYQFEEATSGGHRGVVIRDYRLPPGKYKQSNADLLILIPQGYPDSPLDMFYMLPWAVLLSSGSHPTRADVSFGFLNANWQRWSRHSSDWRPGRDGIWTMIKRCQHALETAV